MATSDWFSQFAPTNSRGLQPLPRVTQPDGVPIPTAAPTAGFGVPPGDAQRRTLQMPAPLDPATYSGVNPTPGPSGTQPGQAGAPSGAARANDPAYIRSEITRGFNEFYGRNPTEQEIQQWTGYATTPDTYSDGTIHQGWNPYLYSRINPANAAASDPSLAGTDTLIGRAPAGGGASSGGGQTLGAMANGSLLTPYGKEFDPNVALNILDTPAFKAAQQNATDALSRSAAAKGTLLTGGFAKDLSDYQMGMGPGAINDEYQRQIGGAGFNRDTLWGDQNNAYNKYLGFAQLGQQGASTLGGFGSGYATNTGNNARTSADLATGLGDAKAAGELARSQGRSSTLAAIANAAGGIDWRKALGRA